MLFSYPIINEQNDNSDKNIPGINNDMTFNNINRSDSHLSFLYGKQNKESKTVSFNPLWSQNIDSARNRESSFNIFSNNKTPTGNYEMRNDLFTYEYISNQNSTKNANAPSEFSFNKQPCTPSQMFMSSTTNNADGANEMRYNDFQFPTPTMNRFARPVPSPSNANNYPDLLSNRQTPGQMSVSPSGIFGKAPTKHTNTIEKFANIFKPNNNDGQPPDHESEISFDKNDGKITSAEPPVKFKPKGLELDLDILGDNGTNVAGDVYPSNAIRHPSPLNFPQS